MGGNLFKLGRIPAAQYQVIEAELRAWLEPRFGEAHAIPRYYRSKPDFGDADIILNGDAIGEWQAVCEEIIEALGVTDSKRIKRLLSTVYQGFQVDFFLRPEARFRTTWHYLCYNDLGNLLGKIYRRFNLKYGEHGLSYVFRRAEQQSYTREIHLSSDWRRILAVLGLDYADWDAGFDTLEQMFEWVIGCEYFSVAPYRNMSAGTRKRLEQRSTVQRFLEHLDGQGVEKAYAFEKDRDTYLPWIAEQFPEAGLLTALERERAQARDAAIIRAKFNGGLVMSLFAGLKGKRLGEFIRSFRAGHDEAWLLEASPAQIEAALRAQWSGEGGHGGAEGE